MIHLVDNRGDAISLKRRSEKQFVHEFHLSEYFISTMRCRFNKMLVLLLQSTEELTFYRVTCEIMNKCIIHVLFSSSFPFHFISKVFYP